MVPQCTSSGRVGRNASTSCWADALVKQMRSITTSGRSAAIRSPNVPSASSASRSAVTVVTASHCGLAWYGPRIPRLTAITSWPPSTSRGTRYVPMCPVAPMTTTRLIAADPSAARPYPTPSSHGPMRRRRPRPADLRRYGTGTGTNSAMASATAAGSSIGTHVLAPGTRDQRGAGEVGGKSSRVRHREEAARLAPDQQDRPVEPRDRLGGVDEELRAKASGRRDQIVGHPPITPRRPEERLCALGVQSARGDGGDAPAPGGRRSRLQPDQYPGEPGECAAQRAPPS